MHTANKSELLSVETEQLRPRGCLSKQPTHHQRFLCYSGKCLPTKDTPAQPPTRRPDTRPTSNARRLRWPPWSAQNHRLVRVEGMAGGHPALLPCSHRATHSQLPSAVPGISRMETPQPPRVTSDSAQIPAFNATEISEILFFFLHPPLIHDYINRFLYPVINTQQKQMNSVHFGAILK